MHYMLRNKYPVETVEQVKVASDYVAKHLSRFDPVDRTIMALRLEKRASELGVVVDAPWVANYGRFTNTELCYSPEFNVAMGMRKEACGDSVVQSGDKTMSAAELCDHMMKAAESMHPHDMAGLISDFDKMAGIDGQYDVRLRDPIFTVCGCESDPFYDQVKIAGVPEKFVVAHLNSSEGFDKVASVLGESGATEFKANPSKFLNDNPFVRSVALEALK